jgi:D-arabinose 1-dehydrogenase-like Zn-dependent alcohol dehydrogenase
MRTQKGPLVPSHEPTGVVVKLGSQAAELSENVDGFKDEGVVKVGDRVGSTAFGSFCGKCDDCKAGGDRLKYCNNQQMAGITTHGAFAQYCAVDVRSSVRLPSSLDFDTAAPLMCAGATIWTAIKGCGLEKGQSVAIIGSGSLGHLGCQFAKCLGLRTIMVDSRDAPLEMCKKLPYPPDITFNSSAFDASNPESVSSAIEACGGNVDAVILATDALPAYKFGFELVKKHGLFMVVGQPAKPIEVQFFDLIFKDVTIKGSLLGSSREVKEMVDLVAEKKIECRTKAYNLDSVHQLMVRRDRDVCVCLFV